MSFSINVSIPSLQKEIPIIFPSDKITIKDARDIVKNELDYLLSDGELYVSIDGELLLPTETIPLLVYNFKSPHTNLIYRKPMKEITICITKKYLVDLNTPIQIFLEGLRNSYIINDDSKIDTFISEKKLEEISINDILSNNNENNIENKNIDSSNLIKLSNSSKISNNNDILYITDNSKPKITSNKVKSPRVRTRRLTSSPRISPKRIRPVSSPRLSPVNSPRSNSPRNSSPRRQRTPRNRLRSSMSTEDEISPVYIKVKPFVPKLTDLASITDSSKDSDDDSSSTERTDKKRSRVSSFMRLGRNKSSDTLSVNKINFIATPTRSLNSLSHMDDHEPKYFGVSLEDTYKRDGRLIPLIVEQMINELEIKEAHKIEGIFRVCGNQDDINELINSFEKGKSINLSKYNAHVITNCLKYYIQSLPEPVLTYALNKRFISALQCKQKKWKIAYFKCLLSSLPETHNSVCKILIRYMKIISQYEKINKMDTRSLGIIIGPLLWRTKEDSPEYINNFLEYSKYTADIGKFIIREADKIFIPTTPLYSIISHLPFKTEKKDLLSIPIHSFVFIFEKLDKNIWVGECNNTCGMIKKSYILDTEHQHFDLTKEEITINILQKLDPEAIKVNRSNQLKFSAPSLLLSPRTFFKKPMNK